MTATALIATVGYAALAAYLAILAVKYALARRQLAIHTEEECAPGEVTVLQAILSGDHCLAAVLRENVAQSAPTVRFLWLVDEDDPEGQRIAAALALEAAGRVEVMICPKLSGNVNPKTAKLAGALPRVSTPYVAVLDDDTTLAPDHLGKAVRQLEQGDLYTGLPWYLEGDGFWSSLVAHWVNSNSAMTYLAVPALTGPLTINGMFYVMRTETLRRYGGFSPILTKLCDDYALARLVQAHGGRILQGVTPHTIRTSVAGGRQYVALLHRWLLFANVLVADQPPRVLAVVLVLLGLPPLLLWLGLLVLAHGWWGAAALAGALLVRHAALRSLHRALLGRLPPFSAFRSILVELLQPLHWAHAALQPTMRWRSRRIRLQADGQFVYLGGPAGRADG